MKTFLLIITILISQLSFAGTGGGGVMMMFNESLKSSPQIVYHMGQQDGVVKFAHGYLVNNEWQVEKVEMPEADLQKNKAAIKALEQSKSLNDWAEVK